jgi:hypothetical protein
MSDDMLDRLFGELANADIPVPARARVVARGLRRRRRARAQAATGAVAACALVVAGAIQLAGPRPGVQPIFRHGTRPPAVCAAAPDAALNAQLRRLLPVSDQAGVSPIALSPDGATEYVETTAGGFHGVAEESVRTGAILRQIASLPAADTGATGGLGLAGDLLWSASYPTHGGQGTPGTTPVRLWSPRTGRASTLEPPGQHGGVLSAPVLGPAATHQYVAWEQTSGDEQEIVEANLLTGATVRIARGYLGPPVFVGDALVWPAASHNGGPATHLVARNDAVFPARQPVAVPPALSAASQSALMGSDSFGYWPTLVGLIASDDGATAYYAGDLTELFYSPSPATPARLVLQLHGGSMFAAGAPALGPGYIGWTVNGDASYLASASSLAAARITTNGAEYSAGGYVLVMGFGTKIQPARNPFWLFSGSVVRTLKCAAPVRHASS